jgi:hypothetical protein
MWPFTTGKALDSDRLAAIERRLDDCERLCKTVDLEWSETYEKMRRLIARLAKRDEREREAAPEAPGAPNGEGHGLPQGTNPLALALLNRGR